MNKYLVFAALLGLGLTLQACATPASRAGSGAPSMSTDDSGGVDDAEEAPAYEDNLDTEGDNATL